MRLYGYDYSLTGMYFLTIVVQNRLQLFGYVRNGIMVLNHAGLMVENRYWEIEHKFPDKRCHAMVVMPNHFHCIQSLYSSFCPIRLFYGYVFSQFGLKNVPKRHQTSVFGPNLGSLLDNFWIAKSMHHRCLFSRSFLIDFRLSLGNFWCHNLNCIKGYLHVRIISHKVDFWATLQPF